MKLDPIPKPGTTRSRKRFWDEVRSAVIASQKIAGRNVTTEEHPGKGTLVSVERMGAGSSTSGCGACADCVCVNTVEISSAGSGYRLAERLSPFTGTLCDPADSAGFSLIVTGVDGSGAVTDFVIVPGLGYTTPPSNPISLTGSALGSGFEVNGTFLCVTGTKPCPESVAIEFHDVIFDCGCIATGGAFDSSRTVEEGEFNDHPEAWTKQSSCGGTAVYDYGPPSSKYQTFNTGWDNPDCSGDPVSEELTFNLVYFFLRGNVYRLLAFAGWSGASNRQLIFDGTTTDLSLPIANTVSACDPAIAHGGTATVT